MNFISSIFFNFRAKKKRHQLQMEFLPWKFKLKVIFKNIWMFTPKMDLWIGAKIQFNFSEELVKWCSEVTSQCFWLFSKRCHLWHLFLCIINFVRRQSVCKVSLHFIRAISLKKLWRRNSLKRGGAEELSKNVKCVT